MLELRLNAAFLPLGMTFTLQGHVTELWRSYLGKYLLVLDDVFIGGQQHIELPAAQLWYKSAAQAGSPLEAEEREMCFWACWVDQYFLREKNEGKKKMLHNNNKKKIVLCVCLYLVCNFDHRGRPFVKLVDPVGQSPAEKWRNRWQQAQHFKHHIKRKFPLFGWGPRVHRAQTRADEQWQLDKVDAGWIQMKCLSSWLPLIYIKKENKMKWRMTQLCFWIKSIWADGDT